MRRFFSRLIALLRPGHADASLEREVLAHLALIEDDLIRQGLSPDEARLAARRRFGGIDQTKEQQRDARSFLWIEDLRRDIRYALRTLARTPIFATAAVLTLAIGIGGTTAVFSLVDAVLLQRLPFPHADRIVMVYEDSTKFGFPRNDLAPVMYAGWSRLNDVFDSTAGLTDLGAVLDLHGEPVPVSGTRVTSSLFDVLGAQALLGRVLLSEDDRPDAKVAVLAFGLWQNRFGGDPAIVGRTITINNEPYLVVGVMPKSFQFLLPHIGLWVPAGFTAEELRNGAHYVTMVGSMKAGVDITRVRANLDAIGIRIRPLLPADREPPRAVIVSLKDVMSEDARGPLLLLMAAIGGVLIIACANLASLLLARAAARSHEIALRGALGASRGRIVRQLLTESFLLALGGLMFGILLARWSFSFLQQLVPPTMTAFAEPALSGTTFVLAAGVSILTGVLFGLGPALSSTRRELTDALKASGRGIAGSQRGGGAFVVAEVALTLVLLVAAGLLLQTFYRMRYADLGVRPGGLLTLRTGLPLDRYGAHAKRVAFYDRVLADVERLPGVVAAGYTTSVPLEWKGATNEFAIEGVPPVPGSHVRRKSPAGQRGIPEGHRHSTCSRPLLRRSRQRTLAASCDHQRGDGPTFLARRRSCRSSDRDYGCFQQAPVAYGCRHRRRRATDGARYSAAAGTLHSLSPDRQPALVRPSRPCRTHGERSDGDGRRREAGRASGGPDNRGVERPNARRGTRRRRGFAPDRNSAARRVRWIRVVSRSGGYLRPDCLFRRAARARDGGAHRTRRQQR